MTLPRTIHRRNARRRARLDAARRQAEWDALTPEQQDRRRGMAELLKGATTDEALAALERNVTYFRVVNRDYR